LKIKVLAIILVLMVFFTMSFSNLSVIAKTNTPEITFENALAKQGQNISVKVLIENNPGIWGMDIKLSYDKTALTLISVENGDFYQTSEWTQGNLSSEEYILSYESDYLADITTSSGILAILNFKINNTAEPGDYMLTATYKKGDIINVSFEEIDFNINNGNVTVKSAAILDYISGDINNDSLVDLTDVVILSQYVAKWNVDVNAEALDPNSDKNIDLTDVVLLSQYVAGWDVELF